MRQTPTRNCKQRIVLHQLRCPILFIVASFLTRTYRKEYAVASLKTHNGKRVHQQNCSYPPIAYLHTSRRHSHLPAVIKNMCAKDVGLEIIQGRCRGTERLLIRSAKVTPFARLRAFSNARRKSWVQAISPGLALQIKITFSTRRKKEHNNGNYLLGRSGKLNAGGLAFFAEYLKQQSISMRRRPLHPA